jgi:hypothetical protein
MRHGTGGYDIKIDVLALGDGAEVMSTASADPQPQGDVPQ